MFTTALERGPAIGFVRASQLNMPEVGHDDGRPPIGTPTSERARSFFGRNSASDGGTPEIEEFQEDKGRPTKWSMGVLNDPATHEVPGELHPQYLVRRCAFTKSTLKVPSFSLLAIIINPSVFEMHLRECLPPRCQPNHRARLDGLPNTPNLRLERRQPKTERSFLHHNQKSQETIR